MIPGGVFLRKMFIFPFLAMLLISMYVVVEASEPEALYLHIPVSPEQYNAYRYGPLPVLLPGDATDWMDEPEDYRARIAVEVAKRLAVAGKAFPTVDDYLNSWPIWPPQLANGNRQDFIVDIYDPKQQVWTFALWEFSENYLQIVEMLTVLRGIANHVKPDQAGIVALYSYEWRHPWGNVCFSVEHKQSRLVRPFPPSEKKRIEAFFDQWAKRLSRIYRD